MYRFRKNFRVEWYITQSAFVKKSFYTWFAKNITRLKIGPKCHILTLGMMGSNFYITINFFSIEKLHWWNLQQNREICLNFTKNVRFPWSFGITKAIFNTKTSYRIETECPIWSQSVFRRRSLFGAFWCVGINVFEVKLWFDILIHIEYWCINTNYTSMTFYFCNKITLKLNGR